MTISHINPKQLLPEDGGSGKIVQIGPDRLEEAIERLTSAKGESDPAHARQFIQFTRQQRIELTWLWSRLDDRGRVVLSALFVPSPGRTCMVFTSNPVSQLDIRSLGEVLDHGCTVLADSDVDLAQALLEPSEGLLKNAFSAAGFDELTMLSYLERPVTSKRANSDVQWPPGVTVEPFREDLTKELLSVLDASYVETQDCPGLFGLRRTEDILAGHKSSGEFDPALWTLLRIDGEVCGTLMLNPSPESRAIELVYMGLAPSARGRKLGALLLNHGLSQLTGRSEHNITLAVDERNAPALALYRKAGFRAVLRRRAMIRSLRPAPGPTN